MNDPKQHSAQDVVIFDGECNFCRSQIAWLKWFDRGQRLRFVSLHDPWVTETYPDLTYEMLMEQLWIVPSSGQRFGGADAVRYLTRRLPTLWPFSPLLHFPGSMPVWRYLYRLVARYRYRLAGRTCENGTCQLHLDKLK